jgi:hypothetical protein
VNVHWKKLTNESKGKPEQKYDASFGTILSITVFLKESNSFILIFLLNYAGLKFQKTIRACTESTDLIV